MVSSPLTRAPLSQGCHRPRVLLADDDVSVSTAIARLLSSSCDVVRCVADSAALFEATVTLRPDVVLLDFSLPGGLNGAEVCQRIKAMTPDVQVVALTANDDPELMRLAYESGASGFVWKLQTATDLLRTIRAVVDRTAPNQDDTG